MKRLNNKSWFTMRKTDSSSAEIMIYDDIGIWGITAKDFVNSLVELGDVKNLIIRINSYGGEVIDGFAIYNRLREHAASKTVIVDGVAASIASVIAMVGDTVKIPQNGFFMIHDPGIMVAGTSKDLKNAASLLDDLKKRAIDTYRTKAEDLSNEEIAQMMEDETWIGAESARSYGFADEIIDETENDEPVTNKDIKLPENLKEIFLSLNKPQPAGMLSPTMQGGNMHKCPHCQKDINEGDVFCKYCGKAIATVQHQPPAQEPDVLTAAHNRERDEAVMAERTRINDINVACKRHNVSEEFAQELIKSNEPYEKCVVKILDKIDSNKPAKPLMDLKMQKDESEKFRMHASNCLAVVAGIERDPEMVKEAKKDVPINNLHGLMARTLQRAGVDPIGMSPEALTKESIQMAGTGSSDLPAVLEDVANKSLQKGYNEAPVTWSAWMGTMGVTDFKTSNLVSMSNFGDIDDLPEGMPFKDGKFSDKKEQVSVDTKGKKFTITRNALINDDLGALVRIPRLMTGAVARRQNKDVYDLLTSNSLAGPTMNEDSNSLFDATNHLNVYANSSVPSVSSIARADQYLMEMPLPKPEPDSTIQYSNVTGKYLITGSGNKLTTDQLLNTPYDNSKSITGVYNPYTAGVIVPVYDAYLQALLTAASKASAWYFASDSNVLETFVMAFLQGNQVPTLQGAASGIGDPLGFSWHIFFDWGIGVADYRGIIYCDGVTA